MIDVKMNHILQLYLLDSFSARCAEKCVDSRFLIISFNFLFGAEALYFPKYLEIGEYRIYAIV